MTDYLLSHGSVLVSKLLEFALPQYDKNCNTKEVTSDFTLGNCNKDNVADLFCLYVSKYYSGGKYTAMHWFQCLLSLWYV